MAAKADPKTFKTPFNFIHPGSQTTCTVLPPEAEFMCAGCVYYQEWGADSNGFERQDKKPLSQSTLYQHLNKCQRWKQFKALYNQGNESEVSARSKCLLHKIMFCSLCYFFFQLFARRRIILMILLILSILSNMKRRRTRISPLEMPKRPKKGLFIQYPSKAELLEAHIAAPTNVSVKI